MSLSENLGRRAPTGSFLQVTGLLTFLMTMWSGRPPYEPPRPPPPL
jgi:hypothetical protein